MAKLYAFMICIVVIFSTVALIDGRSKTQKSSANSKLSMPGTLGGNDRNRATLLKSSDIDSMDLSSEVVSKGKAGKSNHRRERNRNRKSKKKPRKNRQRATANHQNIDSNDIIRETMIQMFGFDHMPLTTSCDGFDCSGQATRAIPREASLEKSLNPPQFIPTPPSFMLELYRNYSGDKDMMILHSRSQGNTVRSFFPSPANPQHRDRNFGQAVVISPVSESGPQFTSTSVFLYNITLIPQVEDLVAAEIRLDGPLAETQTDVMVGVYRERRQCEDGFECNDNTDKIFTKIGRTVFLNSISGTRWSDPKLARLAKRSRQNGHVIVVRFMNDHGRDEASSLRMRRHFERKPDLPSSFVCNDSPESRKRRSSNDMQGDRVQPSESSVPIFIAYCNDPRTSAETESVPAAPLMWKALENVTSSRRVRRSANAASDRLPTRDDQESQSVPAEKRSQHTRDAPTRNVVSLVEKRKNGSKRRRKNSKNNLQVPRNSTLTSNTIDNQNRRQSKKNRNRGKNNRRSGRKNRPRKNERIDIKLHSSLLAEERKQSCRRRSLTVSFEDIGWSPWIISPKHFEAYYCSGNCDLTQAEETSATNHAIIQSVVKNIAGHSELPSPCCVPDKLMSLSVLFFDQERNVVLKNFPNMSVETCGCR